MLIYAAMIDNEAERCRFEDIYYGYRKQMLLVAQGILHDPGDAEDAVQNALLGIAQKIHSIPSGNEKIIRAYVLTAAKNAALSMLPKKKERDKLVDISEVSAASDEDMFERVAAMQDYDLLLRIILQLPARYRDVLMLILVHGLSVKEAAKVLRLREGTVRQQLNRGKKLLVELSGKEGICYEK